jgi:tRNA (mo5U34)-methyltransferase
MNGGKLLIMPTFKTRTVVELARNIRLSFHIEAALTGFGAVVDRFVRSHLGKPSASPPSQTQAPTTQQIACEQPRKPLQARRAKLVEQSQELEQASQQLASKDQELDQARQQRVSKSREPEERHQLAKMREEYHRLAEDFYEKALEMGYGDLRNYLWYHTIDLGNGLVTPGIYDYRLILPAFNFPADMKGLNVLDVGSATGFFAFEFEKRGASVVSIDIPPVAVADKFPGEPEQKFEKLKKELKTHDEWTEQHDHLLHADTAEEMYHFIIEGPFEFCHEVLDSKVQRRHSNIYDLSKENLGRDDFDLVFLGDVLVHTIDPLKALAAVAPLCRGTLIISQDLPEGPQPAMLYVGGDKAGDDRSVWWLMNRLCLEQILRRLGFKEIAVVGEHSGLMRPEGALYKRTIIHATR